MMNAQSPDSPARRVAYELGRAAGRMGFGPAENPFGDGQTLAALGESAALAERWEEGRTAGLAENHAGA